MPVMGHTKFKATKMLSRQKARIAFAKKSHLVNLANIPTQPTLFSKRKFLRALPGTSGIFLLIAKNLKVNTRAVKLALDRPDWIDVLPDYEAERQAGIDRCLVRIMRVVDNGLDDGVATTNARWILNKLRKQEYGDDIPANGAANHLHLHKTTNVNVDIDKLNLSIEARRAIVEAMDLKEEEENKQKLLLESKTT